MEGSLEKAVLLNLALGAVGTVVSLKVLSRIPAHVVPARLRVFLRGGRESEQVMTVVGVDGRRWRRSSVG